jgi:phospholipid/cholesterol/gamma-HCH transport system substrate-binding protein
MRNRIALLVTLAIVMSSCSAIGITPSCGGTVIIGVFKQVGDLVEDANVQSSDVEIGTVSTIELDGWNARVTMCIDADQRIPEDSRLEVRTTSLLGEKFVDIQPQSEGGPYLADGDIVGLDHTGKATELEEVFAKLASVLGTGNLEQINRFTASQATILQHRAGDIREVLTRLRRFTDVLNGRRDQIATSVDSLDSVAKTVLGDSGVLESFLKSFAGSAKVLSDQKHQLQGLLVSLDRFSSVASQLLNSTEQGLDKQLRDLRPVLETAVANSANLKEGLETLATFTQWFPETMPGDYLQLDVCQAPPNVFSQGTSCPQSLHNDKPGTGTTDTTTTAPDNAVRYLLHVGDSRTVR